MSHLQSTGSLTSSRYPSQSNPLVPSSSPFLQSQSTVPASSSSPQSLLNHKLIPRDYLNISSNTANRPNVTSSDRQLTHQDQPHDLRFKHSRSELQSTTSSGPNILRSPFDSTPLPSSGKGTPESDILGYDDLKISTASLPGSAEPQSFAYKRQVPKPDSPTLHLDNNPLQITMPRTSSIDSAISTVSNTSSPKNSGDLRDTSPASVRSLIATAGSAEALVAHLLKEKNTVATQNAQLWKLVEKQRALLLGLNKDLDRATKERDRYKKKLKEVQQTESAVEKSSRSSSKSHMQQNTANLLKAPEVQSGLREHTGTRSRSQTGPVRSPMNPQFMPKPLESKDGHRRLNSRDTENNAVQDKIVVESIGQPQVQISEPPVSDRTKQPALTVIASSPSREKPLKSQQSTRKAPPKPLNLGQPREALAIPHQDSATSEHTTIEEEPERGRRRTREEDDRDRELSALKVEDARSRSMKEAKEVKQVISQPKVSVEDCNLQALPIATPSGLPVSPRPQHAQTFLSPKFQQASSLGERMLASTVKSPGLPVSPRPMHNTSAIASAFPLSPRTPATGLPLSPRAPKQPLPVPVNTNAPVDAAALLAGRQKVAQPSQNPVAAAEIDRLQVYQPITAEAPPIYKGLAVASYPNLLLPPNALPSIQVKVASSHLRPSRNSVLGIKSQEDSTVYSLSVISRSSNSELWRVDKIPSSLPQLELELKTRCSELPKMPDRKLFAGQSPAHLDTRRKVIDSYFDELLDIHLDEQAAVMICRFLSSDVVDPNTQTGRKSKVQGDASGQSSPLALKTGYLTKKGKNFGGWKTRYFSLDGPELRYYESPNGSHIGTIRTQNAQIGKQKSDDQGSEDQDSQFRHAFLIQEPKRKDATTYTRHVLCAESDAERDDWVRLLIRCSEGDFTDDSGRLVQSSSINTQTISPTPTSGSSTQDSPAQEPYIPEPRKEANVISAPKNGGVITDSSAWGNKIQPTQSSYLSKDVRDKSSKMGNIFSFKKADAPPSPLPDSKPKVRILRHNGYVRPVFGLSLSEAVEYCAPFNVEVYLPAVVYRSIEYLRYRNAANEEGLFRLSGSNTTVRTLKDRFNLEGDVDLVADETYHDVHAVASLFKSFLRELPASLLTRELHVQFTKVLELTEVSQKVTAFNALVFKLPAVNFILLKELSHYLLEVTLSADKNKMSVRNMGIVFSPTLNIPPPIFHLFLTEYQAIFETDPNSITQARVTELKPPSLAPSDIRSPRNQMFSNLPTPSYNQSTFAGLPANPHDRSAKVAPGDFGFIPVQQSYESGNYVSKLRDPSAEPPQFPKKTSAEGGVSSLDGMLAPATAAGPGSQRRHSALVFQPVK